MAREEKVIKWDGDKNFVRLFDEQFSIADFGCSVKEAEIHSQSVLDSARNAVKKAYEKKETEPRFVLDMNGEIKKAIDDGEVRLDTGKNGEIYAQLRCTNGRLGEKIPVKEELQEEGITEAELQLAMQMEAIKEQLENIIENVKRIEGKVTEVIQGQRNDRIGLFYSGLSLYLEAKTMTDQYLKKQILAQALKAISDSQHQVIQDLRSAMEYLMTERYKKNPKDMRKNVDEKLGIIHHCYEVIYKAAFLKAKVYQESGEFPAMIMAIDEYARFVENLIIPFVGRLSELDSDSQYIETSVWWKMGASLSECKEIKKRLASEEVHYLRIGERKKYA